MNVLESDLVICVDVDDTLVSWKPIGPETPPHESCETIDIEFNGANKSYWLFSDNVRSLEAHFHKGHRVVVWSGSGHAWAATVVRTLRLERFVDLVMAKPKWLLDDMKPQDFMPTPYWGAGDPGKVKLK